MKLRHYVTVVAAMMLMSSQAQEVRLNLENKAVQRFLSEVTYTSRADESQVGKYVSLMEDADKPQLFVVNVSDFFEPYFAEGKVTIAYSTDKDFTPDSTTTVTVEQCQQPLYGLLPGKSYRYRVLFGRIFADVGQVETEGQVRMIYVPSMRNVRDIGGWPTVDGRRVKYGKIYRGSELNGQQTADSADVEHLRQLGIGAELDMRSWYEEENDVSAFGFLRSSEVGVDEVPTYLYTSDSGQLPEHLTQFMYLYRWRLAFQFIVKNLRMGRAVYQHCRHGADRTGYLSLLLEGLLGVTYDGMTKDYELTAFLNPLKTKANSDLVIEYIESLAGETLQDKFKTFWLRRVGVSQEDVDYFINEMLEGEAHDVTTGITRQQLPYPTLPAVTDLSGRRTTSAARGLIIERLGDGSVRKVFR